jgi:hypothetical protein
MMTGLLVFAIFTLTVGTLGAYSIVAPWWTTRSGTAYFVLFLSLALLSGFFLVAEIAGEQPEWVKDVFLALVVVAIVWNAATIVWKQLHYWKAGATTPEPHGPSRGL